MSEFKNRLEELIKEKGIAQIELARTLNLSKNQIHYWIKGKSEPSIDEIIALADFFGITTDYLLGRADY